MIRRIFANHLPRLMLLCGCIIYLCGLVLIVVSGYTYNHHYSSVEINIGDDLYTHEITNSSTEALAIIYPTCLVSVCVYTIVALWSLVKSESNKHQAFHLLQINLLICVLFMSPPCYYQLTSIVSGCMNGFEPYLSAILVGFLLHWTIIAANVLIFVRTNWFQRLYISLHCLIQFTKILMFVIFAGFGYTGWATIIIDFSYPQSWCLRDFRFGGINCDDCNYHYGMYDDWLWNATDICRYCATYHDDYCGTHDFAVGWVVFFVIYCVAMILTIGCGCISCVQTVGILHNEHEQHCVANYDIDSLDLNIAASHVAFKKLTLSNNENGSDKLIPNCPRLKTIMDKLSIWKDQLLTYLYDHNMDLGTFMAMINALISIVGTSITLISQTAGKNGTCIEYKERDGKRENEGLKADCTISIVTIAIGVFILLVIAFRYVIPKCTCFAIQERKKGWCFKIMWSLVDEHLRGTIGVKFLYFILKPLLVALTNSSGKTSTLVETFRVLYLILMFCSATALAYITFNKKYKLLLKLDNIMHNPVVFSKTYIVTYLLSIMASYSVLVIVCVFARSEDMSKSYWSLIIYPQCLWLLIVKLYHNELLQLIQMVNITTNKNRLENSVIEKPDMTQDVLTQELLTDVDDSKDPQESKLSCNYNTNVSGKMVQQVTRLFLYQLGAWLAAIFAWVFYFYCIVTDMDAARNSGSYDQEYDGYGWKFMWYWQFSISLCVVIVMPIAMISSLYKKARLH